jgi:hypothetical protein
MSDMQQDVVLANTKQYTYQLAEPRPHAFCVDQDTARYIAQIATTANVKLARQKLERVLNGTDKGCICGHCGTTLIDLGRISALSRLMLYGAATGFLYHCEPCFELCKGLTTPKLQKKTVVRGAEVVFDGLPKKPDKEALEHYGQCLMRCVEAAGWKVPVLVTPGARARYVQL